MPPARLPSRSGCLPSSVVAVLLLALAAVAVFAAWLVLEVALGRYEGRIYPHVYVLGTDLGGLTPGEAATRLAEEADQQGDDLLVLRAQDQTWRIPWSEAGLQLNVEATVQAAYAVGRSNPDPRSLLRLWLRRYQVAPVYVMDPQMARAALERLAPEVAVPPVNAALSLEGGQVVALPGQPGQALDVEATLDHLITTVSRLGPQNAVALTLLPVPPRIADATPAQAQAQEMLDRQVQVVTYDVLTDETFAWTLSREELIRWLEVEPTEDGAGLMVRTSREAIQATLSRLASEMGQGRGFRPEAADQVLQTFEAGGGAVELYLTHPPRTYTVGPGDRLNTIAARFGMPPGLIAEANPGVDLNWLRVGQELIIPSQDLLTPYLPVRGKRIVVSIPEQRMRVYENDMLIYEWPVSTGIADSPTYTGVFQVLSKEENAYASQWNLWMPHFLAVYRAGGEVYNGIHALPILSSGRRLWAGLLGSPASYGCIILGIEEAQTLYNWAEMGVVVVIE